MREWIASIMEIGLNAKSWNLQQMKQNKSKSKIKIKHVYIKKFHLLENSTTVSKYNKFRN